MIFQVAIRLKNGARSLFHTEASPEQATWGHDEWRSFVLASDPEIVTCLVNVK